MQQAGKILEGPGYKGWKKNWGKPKHTKDLVPIADGKKGDKKETKVNTPEPNVEKVNTDTKRNVPKRNVEKEEEQEKKTPIIEEEIMRKYNIESNEQVFAYDTAVEYNDLSEVSIRNYQKLLKKLGLPMFQRVKAYVGEREGVRNKGAYFTRMAKLELS